MIYTITVAFCPAAQLARCLIKNKPDPSTLYVVLAHYPINTKKNNQDIRMIVESYGGQVLDPGCDMGSAQSQWWAINKLRLTDGDYWINLDPDAACDDSYWVEQAEYVLNKDPNCVVISCWSPMVDYFTKLRDQELLVKELPFPEPPLKCFEPIRYAVPYQPTPFNLGLWNYSFFKELGGIPQMFPQWGEVEGPVFHYAKQKGKYHAYLMDFVEDESGKLMSDHHKLEWQDRHARTQGPEQFLGTFKEYLAYKYPQVLAFDTYEENADRIRTGQ